MPAVPYDGLSAYIDENPNAVIGLFVVVKVLNAAVEETYYLSTHAYNTTDGLTSFAPVLTGNINITESMSLEGNPTISYGDVEIKNGNGEYDYWMQSQRFSWKNRDISIYANDIFRANTSIASFIADSYLVFKGLVDDLDSRNLDVLNIRLRDKSELLNIPVSDHKLGTYGAWAGGQNNEDALRPIVWGEVHNMEPLLINPGGGSPTYMFHDGAKFFPAEGVIELRDNGVPIYTRDGDTSGATVDLTAGTFTLTHSLAGQLTASIQAPKVGVTFPSTTGTPVVANTYRNDIPSLIAVAVIYLGIRYGSATSKFSLADLDKKTFYEAQSSWANYAVGSWIADKVNLLELCTNMIASAGGQIYFNTKGILKLLRIGTVDVTSLRTITIDDILDRSLSISKRTDIKPVVKLAYCKNWTVQDNLLTGIPQEHKDKFATEWFTVTGGDPTDLDKYKLLSNVDQTDTLLLTNDGEQVQSLATRHSSITRRPRNIYKLTATYRFMDLELGDRLFLKHFRFNKDQNGNELTSGVECQVVSISKNYLKRTVELELLDIIDITA